MHRLIKYLLILSSLLVCELGLARATIFTKHDYNKDMELSDKLLHCQKKVIQKSMFQSAKYDKGILGDVIIDEAKERYSNLTHFDKKFFVENPRTSMKLSEVARLARGFVEYTCGTYIGDKGTDNAVQHFALNMFASLSMGHEKACEWSTGHEMHNDAQEYESGKFLIVPDRTPPDLNSKMDLVNNMMGLKFASENKKLVQQCGRILHYYNEARNYAKKMNKIKEGYDQGSLFADTQLTGEAKKLYERRIARNIRGIKNPCERVWQRLAENRENLVYLIGTENGCPRMEATLDSPSPWTAQKYREALARGDIPPPPVPRPELTAQ